jgi:hypothetical protein
MLARLASGTTGVEGAGNARQRAGCQLTMPASLLVYAICMYVCCLPRGLHREQATDMAWCSNPSRRQQVPPQGYPRCQCPHPAADLRPTQLVSVAKRCRNDYSKPKPPCLPSHQQASIHACGACVYPGLTQDAICNPAKLSPCSA